MRYQKFQGAENIGEAVGMISRDRLDVALVKAILPAHDCAVITKNFQRLDLRRRRGDNVPGFIIGATHYGRTPQQYFDECSADASGIERVFEGTVDPMRFAHRKVEEHTQCKVRASNFRGKKAIHARAVEWLPDTAMKNEFLLQPHEDISQVDCDRNAGWEIRNIRTVVALNFYASVKTGEGRLRVYDYVPDRDVSEALGLVGTGYPYPLELLWDKSYVELVVEAGDLAVIRGNNVHAVTSTSMSRIVINGFLTKLENELVFWT